MVDQPKTIEQVTFELWMKQVDQHIMRAIGLRASDLADQTFRAWFNDGLPPATVARLTLENEGLM
jgi:hypothetical protein